MKEDVGSVFDHHQLAPNDSKSWLVSRDGKRGGGYWYTITWSPPGHLTLCGDIGEMCLTHYHAMQTWRSAVYWLSGNHDRTYHLGKSDKKRRFSPELTYRYVVRDLNEDAIYLINEWRRERLDNPTLGRSVPSSTIFRWSTAMDFLVDVGVCSRMLPKGEFPTAIYRHKIKRHLLSFFRDAGRGDLQEFFEILRYEDYYGSSDYCINDYQKIEAVYRWAELVKSSDEFLRVVPASDVPASDVMEGVP